MSHLLWKYYWEDDVDKFRRLLSPGGYTNPLSKSPNVSQGGVSTGGFGTSPRPNTKSRKSSGFGGSVFPAAKNASVGLGKGDINARDHAGLTLLLRAASCPTPHALAFVRALLDHPSVDIHVQDPESGWNALHRALYTGNVSVARLLLEKERNDLREQPRGTPIGKVGQLIKTKDHEGNSPFDLYNSTIAARVLSVAVDAEDETETSSLADLATRDERVPSDVDLQAPVRGDELFAFGSNKNHSLGVGDEDDRQFPERVFLNRPDHLVRRFYDEYAQEVGLEPSRASSSVEGIPAIIRSQPLLIEDVVMSKLHTAVLTADPASNLFVCGIGRGGRLGLGDENTRFRFAPVQGGLADKKVVKVALGQNHTMAITDNGELWTWGLNYSSQLGYALPPPIKKDEEPMSAIPRQVFGSLKKELVQGIAASALHSVAHTETSLFCWGRNVGQLALMDADSRSLEVQQTPRKVAASLFSCPIVMVAAIDKATTCLLENNTVCVFTSYGYNIVRFSLPDSFSNLRFGNMSMSTRHDTGRSQISYITSGGDTIAALTERGDLYTMSLIHQGEASHSSVSTTNPSKIKGAVSQPQCIWNARKDGVRSVSIGEHGAVIISTQSGAVWRRIRRPTAKDAYATGINLSTWGDFKFQRVPSVTNIVAVRSSTFGAFAAVRRDAVVMKEEITIDAQSLWDNVASLSCLQGFISSEPDGEDKDNLKFWSPDKLRESIGATAYEVLKSPDLEGDLLAHLQIWRLKNDNLQIQLRTTDAPHLMLPVHGWLLAARSSVLRSALRQARAAGSYESTDVFSIAQTEGKFIITFAILDPISLLNLVHYMYEDRVIPAWNFTRQALPLAYRYRQIRVELMKLATKLGMNKLEAAVRMQTEPSKCMDEDFKAAINDSVFFEDGDVLLELDGDSVIVHSSFVCQRCPWFNGLFNGRSGGAWLTDRRESQDPLDRTTLDLKHMGSSAFSYVLKHLYADVGEELFDDAIAVTTEDLVDLVMDVLSIANELMLDRLSQICQKLIGKFVTTRNIAYLLNDISPCSVTTFKKAGLEYICLQMESMLENHLLDDLDEELLLELDEVVRDNQLARFPFVRSHRVDLLLHQNDPELSGDIEEERRIRVRELAFKASQREDEKKLSSSAKTKYGSLDEFTAPSPSQDKSTRRPKAGRNEPFSPSLRPKDSHVDLMFDMDEEDALLSSPGDGAQKPGDHTIPIKASRMPALGESWRDDKGKSVHMSSTSPTASPSDTRPTIPRRTVPMSSPPAATAAPSTPAKDGSPWGPAKFSTSKLDMREIMSEASSGHSALTASLAAQNVDGGSKSPHTKMSQKERKKQQQIQALQKAEATAQQQQQKAAWENRSDDSQPAPWKVAAAGAKTPLKETMSREGLASVGSSGSKFLLSAELPASLVPRRTASPDTRFSGQSRTTAVATPSPSSSTSKSTRPTPLVPHSKSYITPKPKAEPTIGFGLADIIGQQQREQEIVREAVAKRSLQEIQEEQAFQEWWDQESRRTQEEEARRLAREKDRNGQNKGKRGGRSNKFRGGGRGGGDRGRARGREGSAT